MVPHLIDVIEILLQEGKKQQQQPRVSVCTSSKQTPKCNGIFLIFHTKRTKICAILTMNTKHIFRFCWVAQSQRHIIAQRPHRIDIEVPKENFSFDGAQFSCHQPRQRFPPLLLWKREQLSSTRNKLHIYLIFGADTIQLKANALDIWTVALYAFIFFFLCVLRHFEDPKRSEVTTFMREIFHPISKSPPLTSRKTVYASRK